MINAVIIEDEPKAQMALRNMLKESTFDINVHAILRSVKESVTYFSGNETADIIFSDIQLTDGLSFEIFTKAAITVPIVFITRNEKYLVQALEFNGIDCLLKPIGKTDIEKSLIKYSCLQNHFLSNQQSMQKLTQNIAEKKKSRIVVKMGSQNVIMKVEEIAAFYSKNRLVYAIDKSGKIFLTDKSLARLELELDRSIFYRTNRQYIVNINFIKGYRSFEKVKIKVELCLPEKSHTMVISQEGAPHFRKWVSGI